MKLTVLLLTLVFSLQSLAHVYPDPKEPNQDRFIKITKKKKVYTFRLCRLDDESICEQLADELSYSEKELRGKIRTLKAKGSASGIFGLVTGGLSLLGTAEFYLRRRTIDPKRLMRKKVLDYKVEEDGDVTGTFAFYKKRMVKALNEVPTYEDQ